MKYITETSRNKAFKALSTIQYFLAPTLTIWLMFCIVSVSYKDLENRAASSYQSSENFKRNCVNNKGKVRHEDTTFKLNIYCSKKDGNETIFYSKYKGENLPISVIHKSSFGLINLDTQHKQTYRNSEHGA